jgi:hypothetical protein
MDVDHRIADVSQELAGQDLHVTGENDYLTLAAQQLDQLRLGLRLTALLDGDMMVGDTGGLNRLAEVWVVGGDQRYVRSKFVSLPAIQQRLPGSSWNFDGDPTGIVMVRR